jgi:hypothetical protein
MPAVSYDSQSLMVDGRRVWLVGGTIEYSRIPRGQWRGSIRAAKGAGLNCISAGIPWYLHEKSPRRFTFDGELDLRHFLQLIADEGMYCILRPGPYLGGSFEGGGLPGWLSAIPDMKPREASRPFLDACTRWFAAVMEQVNDFQITSERSASGRAGPVLLMQIEHEWFCSNGDQAVRYLGELIRYLREEGCTTPLIEANNCWQEVEGAFATWHGTEELAANMRQFRVVQKTPPLQQFPLFVSAYRLDAAIDAAGQVYRMAQAMSVGAMVNIESACARATGEDCGALLDSRGNRSEFFNPVKRLATFANQFGHLFANLYADRQHAAAAPLGEDHNLTVLYQHGTQGDVVFLLRSERDKSREARVLMPDGDTLTVPLGSDRAAWAAFNVNLAGVATLTQTNLRPWAFIDRRLLVLFGPAGAAGVVCIDGATVEVTVPEVRSQTPVVHALDGVTLVVLSGELVDASCMTAGGLIIGTRGLDENGGPLPHASFKHALLVKVDGTTQKIEPKPVIKAKTTPRLGAWTFADVSAFVNGSSDKFQPAPIASGLDSLAPSSPYGWFRFSFKGAKPGGNLLAPQWGGRLHAFASGRSAALLGPGGDATVRPFTLKSSRDLVLLACRDDRFHEGWHVGHPQGPAGHLYQVKPLKLGKPKVELSRAPDPTAWRAFLRDVSYHHQPPADAWSWVVKPAGRIALFVRIAGLPRRALLMANGKPVGGYDPELSGGETTVVLDVGGPITAGRNTLTLAFFEQDEGSRAADPSMHVTLHEAVANLTGKSDVAFAPWSMPDDGAFSSKASPGVRGQPCWFRATFEAGVGVPSLSLELPAMSAGRVWLNGLDLGAYSETVRSGKPPCVALPAAWVKKGANKVTVFDESGRPPRRCRLVSIG